MARRSNPDPLLLAQSRALGDPTRHAVFSYIRDVGRPVGVAELTDHFRFNHNAIRQHLAKLRDAGLVIEELDEPSGPGRPRLRYRVAPGATERWGGTAPYEALTMMLLALLRGEGSPREVGRRAGEQFAIEHGGDADAVEILTAVARRLGFEPRVKPTREGVDVVLDRCPFAAPASDSPDIVCELHLGIAEGIAAVAGNATVEGLVVRPPTRAGCRIEVAVAS